MELTLYTEGFFDAAHYLKDYEGKCSNIHGHTWKISIWVKGDESELDNAGILWDFGNIKKVTNFFDHKNLNEIIPNSNPTAEKLSIFIYKKLKVEKPKLKFRVRVYENSISRISYCEYGDEINT